MNLSVADLAELPLAAAVLDGDGRLLAHTPEWREPGPGSVSYPVRRHRLVVAVDAAELDSGALLDRLLDTLARAVAVAAPMPACRLGMLAASLRLVAGRAVDSAGTSHQVIDHARAGISARTGLDVVVEGRPAWPVAGPEAVALVLVQLAVNAERHSRTTSVRISQGHQAFHIDWRGRAGASQLLTSRGHTWRRGWGMGFARIAADTLGGAVYPPVDRGDGTVLCSFELGLRRLALPLALLHGRRVVKATRAWDEETGCPPGEEIGPASRAAVVARAALSRAGDLVVAEGMRSRATAQGIWVAIPPDGLIDRARDVLHGIAHERALWDGVPDPARSRIFALACLLGAQLGQPLPRIPSHAWNRQAAQLWPAFGLTGPPPHLEGIGGLDPRLVAFLAAELGASFDPDGDDVWMRLGADRRADPLVAPLRLSGDRLLLT